jgi:hypothetical protein
MTACLEHQRISLVAVPPEIRPIYPLRHSDRATGARAVPSASITLLVAVPPEIRPIEPIQQNVGFVSREADGLPDLPYWSLFRRKSDRAVHPGNTRRNSF